MEAKKALEEIAQTIDKTVEDIITKEKAQSESISSIIKEIVENITPSCIGGKRLRGAFAYYSHIMNGGSKSKDILQVSAMMELLHSYLLIHDDIMDKSSVRHRMPTIHKIYQNKIKGQYPNFKDSKHFGEAIGICAGDVLCHIGLNILMETSFEDSLKLQAYKKIHREFADTGYGQIIDAFGEVIDGVDEDYVMKVHYYKTGKYTYETPLHVGAILAGANKEDLDILTKYAIPGGTAFQIQDDILGMYGDEYRIGKPANSDLKEGKKTLLIIRALENADETQTKIIEKSLGNPFLKSQDLEDVRKVIIDTGSLQYSKDVAIRLVKQARNALEKGRNPTWTNEGYDFLIGIADYMITRDL